MGKGLAPDIPHHAVGHLVGEQIHQPLRCRSHKHCRPNLKQDPQKCVKPDFLHPISVSTASPIKTGVYRVQTTVTTARTSISRILPL